ncbi:MAG: helix-turn-helix domain-containing protein [Hyphomonadaceae bacterium]|nr:helix-turn-helix domain-containing protein [Hyphomonadaceae bacterium]
MAERRKRVMPLKDKARARLATSLAGYALDVPLSSVEDDGRDAGASFARKVAMYLASVVFGMSLARVAAAFGRDRSTVGHACRCIEDMREDARFDTWMEALERSAAEAPSPFVNVRSPA